MFDALGKILNHVQFGSHERKVKKYLDEATPDSILEDLRKVLAPGSRQVQGLWTRFDAYCIEDTTSQQRYWNEDSFRKHVETVQADAAISEAAIHLLWRCFHFYAYHPFPRDATQGRIDSAAFQRAVALLAVQCTDILGTQDDGDYFWRNDDAFFGKASFERIFRSISLLDGTSKPPTQSDHPSTPVVEDAMDVLAMTQPHAVSLAPSPDQLRPAARKLLGSRLSQTRYRVVRRDLSTWLSLLLRLRLREAKWGSRFHLGTIDAADPGDAELAEVLMNAIEADQAEEDLASEHILRAMDLLPNIQLRFHQLWAVLFQPPNTADDQVPSEASGAISNRILGAVSLFVPQPVVSDHSRSTARQDVWIAPENAPHLSQRSDDVTLTRLVKSLLAQNPLSHLVLFTGDETTATTPATVVGAYFPRSLWLKANAGEEKKRELEIEKSHLLFQLQPQFRLLRWTSPHIPLTRIINTYDDDAHSLQAIAASEEEDTTSPKFRQAYKIGDPERKGAGLYIDPETKSATLTSNPTADADNNDNDAVVWYRDVCADGDGGGDHHQALNKNWEVTFKLDRLNIFHVLGGIETNVVTGGFSGIKDQTRSKEEATVQKIQGEELTKRIQGFGSKI